jgi:tRNA/rRNA methyltransferase
MAGLYHRRTKKKQPVPEAPSPVIVLVEPQLGENIGACARAMLNCALSELRLVAPRNGWPNEFAEKAASGAHGVLDQAQVYDSTAEAIADLTLVYAATARRRDTVKTILTPRRAATSMRQTIAAGNRVGVLFGPERSGLENDDVALAEAVIEVPLNPAFNSLNLAQAVLLVAYEWHQAGLEEGGEKGEEPVLPETERASREELVAFFEHLERELDDCGFLRPVEKRASMVRNIRNLFQRAALTDQEVRTLRGIVAGLTKWHKGIKRER